MSSYVGRFAPSPTGPLHLGSLVAALASYVDARVARGKWLVRMEDLDTPRCVPGAADQILRTLEHFGLNWDGPVLYQSSRSEAYRAALDALPVYACACSRKDFAGAIYPGTCRERDLLLGATNSIRVRVDESSIGFLDREVGWYEQCLGTDVGDFVVRRADGLFTYQLAVVIDDAWQGVTHVVRGADLLDSTPRQIWLQRQLGYPEPNYRHIKVVVNQAGEKLSKQTLAPALDWSSATALLKEAALHLGWGRVDAGSPQELLCQLITLRADLALKD